MDSHFIHSGLIFLAMVAVFTILNTWHIKEVNKLHKEFIDLKNRALDISSRDGFDLVLKDIIKFQNKCFHRHHKSYLLELKGILDMKKEILKKSTIS